MSERSDDFASLDIDLGRVADGARVLGRAIASHSASERHRLVTELTAGRPCTPTWRYPTSEVPPEVRLALTRTRHGASRLGSIGQLYLTRLDELELEVELVAHCGQARRVRPLAARRFGTGQEQVVYDGEQSTLLEVAERLLSTCPAATEARTIPATSERGEPSFSKVIRVVADAMGVEVEIKVDPRLAAQAASGTRTVFLAGRPVAVREAVRLALHEVIGHLLSSRNAEAQTLHLLRVGTCESFEDQEGAAVYVEELAGVLDPPRLRVLAARVIAAAAMHEGALFNEVARHLQNELNFSALDAIVIAERAFRGGGLARDLGYLRGWLRVREACKLDPHTLRYLRSGKTSLSARETLQAAQPHGLFHLDTTPHPDLISLAALATKCLLTAADGNATHLAIVRGETRFTRPRR